MVLGRGSALFRVVRLGGHQVWKARANVAGALDASDVFLYRDSSIAPLLDMRRRFTADVDLLDATIRFGVSLSRSVELAVQWDRILALGPLYPVTLDDLSMDRGMGMGAFFHGASGVHRRLSDFIHQVVVHRRDEAVREWRSWIRKDPLMHPCRWLRPDFFSVSLILRLQVLGCFRIQLGLMMNFERPGFPTFAALGKGRPALRNSMRRMMGWLPLLPEVHLPRLTGQVLADDVQRKGVTAGSLDGWGWRELKVLPVSWYDELLAFFPRLRILVFGPMGCWMLTLP